MKYFVLIIVTFFSISAIGQNLIKNGDFEEYIKCPKGKEFHGSNTLKNVTNPNHGSFDYINTCDNSKFPRYYWGEESPQSGEGFVGIEVYTTYQGGVEYIQLSFKQSLVKGKVYKFKMYLSLADKSILAINKIGVYFSKELCFNYHSSIRVKADIISYEFYGNYDGWKIYEGDYIAKGGETHLSIGNFHSKSFTKTKLIRGGKVDLATVYYYIDNVSLIENNNLAKGIVLNNINFKSGSSDLIKSSFSGLDKIVSVLLANPSYQIEITGHTDNQGKDADNLKLSQDRAKTVAAYLIEKGIDKLRIRSSGKGSQQPIGDNKTEEGRLKNRRVEFKFKQ